MGFHYKSGSITYFEAFVASSKELCKAFRDYPLILAFGWLDIKKNIIVQCSVHFGSRFIWEL